jgi:ATP-dependent Clp protease ATP-binding subunit ClpC
MFGWPFLGDRLAKSFCFFARRAGFSADVPTIEFIIVNRPLAAGSCLAEAVGTFELSAMGPDADGAREVLRRKLKEFFSEEELAGTLGLHRRRVAGPVEAGRIEVRLSAPGRSSAWREKVAVPVDFVRWMEREDLHVAYAPQFQVMVFAPEADELPRRLEKNIRLVLTRLVKDLNLLELSRAEAVQTIEVGTTSVEVVRKTPKQRALAEERTTDETETLKKVAEVLGEEKEPVAFEMEHELGLLAEALRAEARRSVLLVGPAGSGKTALVREFARRRGEFQFAATSFWTTSGSRLMTGPIGYGMWQERCQNICRELAKTNGVLHAGNLDELVEVGKTRRQEQSVGGFLRPWIARGEVQMIAEITPEQLGRIERQEPQLVAAFQQITIPTRTKEQLARILEASWETAPGERPSAAETRETREGLARLQALHERYGVYSAKTGRPVRFLRNILSDLFPKKNFTEGEVTGRFSRETGLPRVLLDDQMPLDLAETERWFSSRVVGQTQAVMRVVDLIATVKARLARPGKPLASLLFIGPTGVGKTEMAKALADFFFGSTARMARFDLNQFNDSVSVQRLIGGLGASEGLLTARAREQPFSVILLDEFEKADPSFFDLLLQILGEGRLTDAAGRLADFSNCVIVMTSNLGAEGFQRGTPGFSRSQPNANAHFEDAVAKFLRPEIFNRLDAIVPFQALPLGMIRSIAERYIGAIRHRHGLSHRSIHVQIEAEVIEHLARVGLDPKYGARPLKRAVERELVVPLAEELAEDRAAGAWSVGVGLKNDKVTVWKAAVPESQNARGKAQTESATGSAGEAVAVRRAMSRMKASSAFVALENQVTFLRDLESRLKKAKWKSPEDLRRLERLPVISRVADAVAKLETEARELETQVLGSLYRKEAGEIGAWNAALAGARARRRELQSEVYEASLERSDELVLAVYSEDKPLLLEMIETYRRLAAADGEVTQVHYFLPATRTKGAKVPPGYVREKAEELKKFFAGPPASLLGVALNLRGDLFAPKFTDEAGLHRLTEEKTTRLALIETAVGKIEEYHPPQGFELQGFIHAKSAPVRRTFLRLESRVKDSVLGERPWIGPGIERCVAQLLDDHLTRKILAATGGE